SNIISHRTSQSLGSSSPSTKMADQEVVADVFCVTAGLVGKQPIGFNSWRTMTDKTEGRDKFAKVMQYGSRFWAWYLLSANNKSEVGQKFYKLYLL
ncbi:unnamed protein product, partial [Heterosigma akashiwo]